MEVLWKKNFKHTALHDVQVERACVCAVPGVLEYSSNSRKALSLLKQKRMFRKKTGLVNLQDNLCTRRCL